MAEFNPSDLIETGSNAIPNGQAASVMRRSMENRNLLSEKGALYAGTGEPYATQDSVGNTYNTAITDAVAAPTQSGQVLVSNLSSGGPDTGLEWQDAAPNAINASQLGGVAATDYAQLSQVVRTDVAQTLEDAQKQTANNNILLRSSATLTSAGWYKICNSPNGVHLRINLANVYSGASPSVVQVDVYKGHTDTNSKIEMKSSGCALGYFTALRAFANGDIEVYCSASTFQTTAICMIELTSRDSSNVTMYKFEPSTNTGNPLKQIDIKNGINTTGGVYENGKELIFRNRAFSNPDNTYMTNNNVTTAIQWANSYGLVDGESTQHMYFENNSSSYSILVGFLNSAGVRLQTYNYVSVKRVDVFLFIVTVYSGYNSQSRAIYPPQEFFIVGNGVVSKSTGIGLFVDPTKLTPSTDNGWTEGDLTTNLRAFEPGEYYVCCTSFTSTNSTAIYSYGTVVVSGKAYEAFNFTIPNGSTGTLNFVGTTSLSGYFDYWVSHTRYTIDAATLWFKKK